MLALLTRIKLLWTARSFGTKIVQLFLDRRVPATLKAITALAAVLIVSPLDIFSDIPVLGMLDDVALLGLLALLFVKLCPAHVVAEYSQKRARRPATIAVDPGNALP